MGEDEKRLYVCKLPSDIEEEEIEHVFNTYGKVVDCKIMRDARMLGGEELRSAFVTYDTVEAAKVAVEVLSDVYRFRENATEPVRVSVARPRVNKADDRGSRGVGSDRGNDRGYADRRDHLRPLPHRDHGRSDDGYDRGSVFDYGLGGFGDSSGCGYGGCAPFSESDRHGSAPQYDGRRNDTDERSGTRDIDDRRDRRGDRGGNSKAHHTDEGLQKGGKKLYVANLPDDITKDALEYVFKNYGRIEDIHIMNGRSQNGQAGAFVVYVSEREAKIALAAMETGYEIRPGQGEILVKYANAPATRDKGSDRSRPY